MKKIYAILVSLIFCGSLIGQNDFKHEKSALKSNRLPLPKQSSSSASTTSAAAAGPFGLFVNPILDITTNKGLILSQDFIAVPLFQDSTVKYGTGDPLNTNETTNIFYNFLGVNLDPKSALVNPVGDGSPICSKADSFLIEEIDLECIYKMVQDTATVKDTLYTWVVWGVPPSTNTTGNPVFQRRDTPPSTSTWRDYVLNTKLTGSQSAAPGNTMMPSAPASNYALIKRVLTVDDSSGAYNSKIINLDIINNGYPNGILIPANNVVSCFYTFVPGSAAYTSSDVSFVYGQSTAPQTINGFAAIVMTMPTSDATNNQVDWDGITGSYQGWNMGTAFLNVQRHDVANQYYNEEIATLMSAPSIFFFISGNSTVGVDELHANFSLGQNEPNPFSNYSLINYQLKTAAKNVSFEIYNVAGVKVYEKTERNLSAGKYAVGLNDINFSSGMYFYSLIVDGNKATKKMMVTK